MTHALTIPLVPPIDVDVRDARCAGLVSRLVAAVLSLLRTDALAVRHRPLARMRKRRAAVGFPYRTTPKPPPTKRDHNCDCVPSWW
jgi:hypothetical protein